jgi:hypothetical protein
MYRREEVNGWFEASPQVLNWRRAEAASRRSTVSMSRMNADRPSVR